MKCFKRIFLDLDGPLLDGRERHYHCYQRIMERYGFKPIGLDEYWENKRARINRRDLLSMSGAEAIYDDFLKAWLRLIESPEMLALDEVQEGGVDCLREWKGRRIELILVTMRKNKQTLDAQLKSTGLHKFLDAVLICHYADGGQAKANAVRSRFKIKTLKEDDYWIGDTEVDWEAANSLGCKIILVANGLRSEKFLNTLKNCLVVPSISSLLSPHE
jgi:phosphoglycolate phosphatase